MCIKMHKERIRALKHQMRTYERGGLPHDSGLFETGVLLRKHSDRMNAFNERWWTEIEQHTSRDQVSLPFVLLNFPLAVATSPFQLRDNTFFLYHHHEIRPHKRYRTYLSVRRYLGKALRALRSYWTKA